MLMDTAEPGGFIFFFSFGGKLIYVTREIQRVYVS